MTLLHEPDFGTPASASNDQINLTIDGDSVVVPKGTSIMRAAAELGRIIPKIGRAHV